MKWAAIIFLIGLCAALVYPRVAPVDVAKFHRAAEIMAPGDYETSNSFKIVREVTVAPEQVLNVVHDLASQTPRTEVFAGSIEELFITYETRSRWFSFPDYTTVQVVEGDTETMIEIFGRARFGFSDLGVNRQRILRWLDGLGLLTVVA